MNMTRNQSLGKGSQNKVPESDQVIGKDNKSLTDAYGTRPGALHCDTEIRIRNHNRGFGSVVSVANSRSSRDCQASIHFQMQEFCISVF